MKATNRAAERRRIDKTVKWNGQTTDVDELKRAQGSLRESEQHSCEIINNVPGLVCTMNAEGEVEFLNQRILDYTGCTFEELRNWAPLVHQDDLDRVLRSWECSVRTGEPYDIEHRIRGADRLYRWFHLRGYPDRDSGGRIIRWYILLTDIDAMKVASDKLRRSEAYLAEAQRLSHTGSFGWDVSTGRITWSEETYRILDCSPGIRPTLELIFDRIHPEDRAHVRGILDRAIAARQDLDFEHRFLFADGSIKYVHVVAHPEKDQFGNLEFIGAVTDVSDRKRAEELVRVSEERYRQIIDNIPGFVSTLKPDGEVEFVNQQTLKYFGRTFEELKEWAGTDAVHPEDLPCVLEALRCSIETGEPRGVELRLRRADGVYRWFELNRQPDRDANGRIVRWYVVHHDIEEKKLANERLRRSEAYLAEAQRLSHTGSFGWIVSRGEVVWSEETYRIFEYDRTVTPTVDLAMQRVHPEDRAGIQEVVDRASKEGADFDAECRLVTPGGVKHIQVIARGSKNLAGDLEFIGAVTDVTEQKQTERALRRSERYLAEGQRLNKSGSWAWDLRTGALFWSEEVFRIYEFDPRNVKPAYSEFMERVHPEDRPALEERARMESTERGWSDSEAEFRIILPDGRMKYLHSIANPVVDKSGEVIEVVGTVTDITERKRAEEASQQSERHLAEAQRLTHTGSFIFDVASRMALHLSDEWYRIYELDPARGVPTWEERLERLHPEDRNKWLCAFDKALKDRSEYEAEFRLLFPDGRTKYLHAVAHPVLNQSGDVAQFIGSSADITARKRAEDELQKAFDEIRELKDQLYEENVALKEEIHQESMFEEIIGSSEALQNLLVQVAKVAPTDSTVLITGETGTGKELIARAIHNRSPRADQAFVRVNCAAIPQSLIASELFGHEKGAFTGATQRRIGRFELAHKGTILLDEVGELSAETQVTLLRVLQERELERIGGNQPISVDVRVLVATNRDLRSLVESGTFRQDLFYRLNVFPIHIPALRDRAEDIPVLVEYLIERYASKVGKKIKHISKNTLELFRNYDWPGNVRELQNVVERALVLSSGNTFTVDERWLEGTSRRRTQSLETERILGRFDADQERKIIEAALAETHGRIAGPRGAAAKLGIPRQTLDSKIRSLGINKNQFKCA